MSKSNSTASGVAISQKIREVVDQFAMRLRGRGKVEGLEAHLKSTVEEYEQVYKDYTGRNLADATILEIGYGARPLRLMWLLTKGYNAWGIDLDRPIIKGSVKEFSETLKKNGVQRVAKSAVRHFLFDKVEWRKLFEGNLKRIDRERLLVGDATNPDWLNKINSQIDFIYSEDVFEHIPKEGLDKLLSSLSSIIAPDGCAIFRPCVFTGIIGGHYTEWYPAIIRKRKLGDPCRVEPWEHLRKKRFKANTYLNEMTISDYRNMISKYFDIESELFRDYSLAQRFLSPEIREELSDYTLEDLFVNNVRFVCRPKRS